MIKRALALILCLMAAATFALAQEAAPYAAPEAGSPLTLEGDMGLLVEDIWYPILNDFAPLKAALGEPDEEFDAPSCVFQGEDKEFIYGGSSIFTNPLGDLDVWYEVYILDEGFETVRGIAIGSSREDVIAAYGEGYYMEDEFTMTYSVSGIEGDFESPCIMFGLTDGVVSLIDIYYPTNTF